MIWLSALSTWSRICPSVNVVKYGWETEWLPIR